MSRRPTGGNDVPGPQNATGQQRHEQLLEALGQLKSIVEEQLASIHDRIDHVAEVVREAVEEIGVLRDAIDDKNEVIEWAAQNGKLVFQLTSMPLDPAASDWARHLNKLTPIDPPDEPDRPTQARYQGTLWPRNND